MTPAADTEKNTPESTGTGAFSAEERAAMKARAKELKEEARSSRGRDKAAADEADVLAKIAEMDPHDRALAEHVHRIVTEAAPDLAPKLYYGQPAYARSGKVVCFFRSGHGDKERYSTFGFSVEANLDDDGMWPTSYALTEMNPTVEKRLSALVKDAVS